MPKFLIAFVLVFTPWIAGAAEVRSLSVKKQGDQYVLESVGYLDASPLAVFKSLLDYGNYTRISSFYLEGRYLDHAEDGSLRVYTLAQGCVLLVCRQFERTERLEIEAGRRITAVIEPEGSNLKSGRSEWQLEREGKGTLMSWRMEMVPDFWVPPLIGPVLIKIAVKRGGTVALDNFEKLAQMKDRSRRPMRVIRP